MVQIGVRVVAVIVKTERLALTVVTLRQCREMDIKEEQHVAFRFCCKVDFFSFYCLSRGTFGPYCVQSRL